MADHEWRIGSRHVLSWHVNVNLALVVDVVGFDDERLGVFRVHLAENVSGNPWVEEFGLLRIDGELLHLSLWNAFNGRAFRGGFVIGPDHKIAVHIQRRILAGFQHGKRRGTWGVKFANRWLRKSRFREEARKDQKRRQWPGHGISSQVLWIRDRVP